MRSRDSHLQIRSASSSSRTCCICSKVWLALAGSLSLSLAAFLFFLFFLLLLLPRPLIMCFLASRGGCGGIAAEAPARGAELAERAGACARCRLGASQITPEQHHRASHGPHGDNHQAGRPQTKGCFSTESCYSCSPNSCCFSVTWWTQARSSFLSPIFQPQQPRL